MKLWMKQQIVELSYLAEKLSDLGRIQARES